MVSSNDGSDAVNPDASPASPAPDSDLIRNPVDPATGLPISRWGIGTVAPGRRVIVRRRLSAAEAKESGRKVTDLIGHVVSVAPFRVRPQKSAGVRADESVPAVEFDPAELIVVKALPDRPVRNSDIRNIEFATAMAFPGVEHRWVDGWLLRAGDGITERSNSAIPLEPSASTTRVPLAAVTEFYARHDLPVRICIPDRICRPAQQLVARAGWTLGPEILVMARSLGDDAPPLPAATPADFAPAAPSGLRAEVLDKPDDAWLSMYHFRGHALPEQALSLLQKEIDGRMCFGRMVDAEGSTVAITRGTLTESPDGRTWLGFSAVEVAEHLRRRGIGTLMGLHMLHWGQQQGADAAYLQVIERNAAGIALYRALNFTEHHRHRYAELTA